jgi:RNA polymerase sigma-70 factor (ECF subfamily)
MTDDGARIVACIPRLRRYARALIGTPGEADDLVQDTLERAWAKLHQLRRRGDPRVWLFSIMHNLFVDRFRTWRARPDEAPGEQAEAAPAGTPGVDRLVLRDLASAMKQLPAPQREVLLLVALEQLTYDEVALSLGIPVGTVMSRLSRGREALRALVEGAPPSASLRVIE